MQKISPQERIDAEKALDSAQRRVQDLAFRLNSTNLAVMLPAETLLEIFMHLKRMWEEDTLLEYLGYDESIGSDVHDEVFSWTSVAGVCTQWRSVALEAPSLWAKIRLFSLADVDMALHRSKNVLLDVKGALPTEDDEHILRAWRLVSQHSHRIRSLSVDHLLNPISPQEGSMDDISFGTFDQLKILKISLQPHYDTPSWVPTGMSRSISQSSTLEHLSGRFLEVGSLRPLISPTLRRLELSCISSKGTTSFAVHQQLLGALKELVQLESLRLHDVLPYDFSLQFDSNACTQFDNIPLRLGNPISMPNLSSLELKTSKAGPPGRKAAALRPQGPVSALALAVFLRHLALPPSTSVTLSNWKCSLKELDLLVSSRTRSTATISNPVPIRMVAIQVHVCQRDRERLHHVELSCLEQELAVAFDCCRCWEQSPVLPTTERCTFKVSATNCTADPREFTLEKLSRRLPLHSIRCLSLSSSELHHTEFYTLPKATRAVLETASEVRTLVVEAAWTEKLPYMLAQDPSLPQLFPKLHTIHIIRHTPLDILPTWWAHDIWMMRLLYALRFDRAGAGRLKQIFVTRSTGFTRQDIDFLREYADEVIWDRE